ncbi:hypothetical protein AAMO2058_000009100 [Amorphochlora amoebiformis]
MSDWVDYYGLLGVDFEATSTDIRKAYKRLALEWHPDRNGGSDVAVKKFQTLQEIYEILSNDSRRRLYNASYIRRREAVEIRRLRVEREKRQREDLEKKKREEEFRRKEAERLQEIIRKEAERKARMANEAHLLDLIRSRKKLKKSNKKSNKKSKKRPKKKKSKQTTSNRTRRPDPSSSTFGSASPPSTLPPSAATRKKKRKKRVAKESEGEAQDDELLRLGGKRRRVSKPRHDHEVVRKSKSLEMFVSDDRPLKKVIPDNIWNSRDGPLDKSGSKSQNIQLQSWLGL